MAFSELFQLLFCNSFSEFLFSSISPCAIFAYFRYMSRFFQPYFKVLRIISQFFSQILAQELAPQLFNSSSFSHISLLFQPYLKVLSTLFLGGTEYPKLVQSSMQTGQELWEHGSSWPMPTQKAKSHTMLQRNISRSPTTRSFTTLEQQPWRLQPDGADFQPRRASKSVETSWPCY